MSVKKTYSEINEKIKKGEAVVVTAEEIIPMVEEKDAEAVAQEVDVVTTATFGPMCSSGVFLNFGHSDPPIRMKKVWLNDVPAYSGIAAVDAYLGATEEKEKNGEGLYGGAHVIQDLLDGKKVKLRALGTGTDCYPNKEVEGYITLADINEAFMFNARNAYQNYAAATNSTSKTLYTYMGVLLPKFGNVTYSTSGQLSPLLNDPEYRTIGIGTRIFFGGTIGYVSWNGTQHNSNQKRTENGVPVGPAGTLSLIGNLKEMSSEFIEAAVYEKYGVSLFVGVGIPIPVLDAEMVKKVAVKDEEIYTLVIDYGVPKRGRPVLARVSYAELKSGHITIEGKQVPTAPLSSIKKARNIANILKDWILQGSFFLQEPVQSLPANNSVGPMKLKGACEE
ncbi:MAG: L-aspartate semialdehyde sulfurtransferase [Clostridia bacterium]|nr:L-aspartate semialdehyde sulfurtransferase [Clostridia bacterium]